MVGAAAPARDGGGAGPVPGESGQRALAAWPVPAWVKLALVAGLLAMLVWPRLPARQMRVEPAREPIPDDGPLFIPLLLFLVAFQVVSGLMYSHLWPAYRQHDAGPGWELLCYVASVALALRWVSSRALACALTAVLLSMASFSLYATLAAPWGSRAAMYLMMAATGIVDLLLLAQILRQKSLYPAYGYGVGALVLGIALGDVLSMGLSASVLPAVFAALIILNVGMVVLTGWRFSPQGGRVVAASFAVENPPQADSSGPISSPEETVITLPPEMAALLSEQEQRVIMASASGLPYREIAIELGISESSVKTYMQRSFRKLGIYRRDQLARILVSSTALP